MAANKTYSFSGEMHLDYYDELFLIKVDQKVK